MRDEGRSERICGACGGKNHYEKTCPHPSTEYRVSKHFEKAKKWAENVSKTKMNEIHFM